MLFKKQIFVACLLLLCCHIGNAQIEVDYAHGKDYNSIGFGGFLNFSFPVSDGDFLTVEGGVEYFNSSDDEELALIPVLAGYRTHSTAAVPDSMWNHLPVMHLAVLL